MVVGKWLVVFPPPHFGTHGSRLGIKLSVASLQAYTISLQLNQGCVNVFGVVTVAAWHQFECCRLTRRHSLCAEKSQSGGKIDFFLNCNSQAIVSPHSASAGRRSRALCCYWTTPLTWPSDLSAQPAPSLEQTRPLPKGSRNTSVHKQNASLQLSS